MKKFSKIITILLAITILLSNARLLRAEDGPTPPPTPGEDSVYLPLKDEDGFSFDKYLITNNGQFIPDLSFEYKIEPGKAVDPKGATEYWTVADSGKYESKEEADAAALEGVTYDSETQKWYFNGEEFNEEEDANAAALGSVAKVDVEGLFEIFAGIGEPVIETADFDDNSVRFPEVQVGDKLNPDLLNNDKVYSKDKVKIDFSKIEFKEPGVYRYIITEQTIYGIKLVYDIEENYSMKRVLDVYVVDVTDPEDPQTPKLVIDSFVMHTTETSIKTTEDMGSKDENIVATAWAISTDLDKSGYSTYPSKQDAEKEIERRRSLPDTDPNYDTDILAKETAVKAKQQDLESKLDAYKDAKPANYNQLVQDVKVAQDAVYILYKGDTSTTKRDIQVILDEIKALDPTDPDYDTNLESLEDELYVWGKDALMVALVPSVDPLEITELRKVIGKIDDALVGAKAALKNANDALDAVDDELAEKYAEVIEAKIALEKAEEELTAVQIRHKEAVPVEIQWKLKDKSEHYTNELATYNLEFGKEVEGNQGSKDKYFKFTLTLEGLTKPKHEYWTYKNTGDTEYSLHRDAQIVAYQDIDETTKPGKYIYDGIEYNTEREAEQAADKNIKYHKAQIPGEAMINVGSDFTAKPTKNSATVYDTEDMQKANAAPATLADTTETEAKAYKWNDPNEDSFYYWDDSENQEKWMHCQSDGTIVPVTAFADIPTTSTSGGQYCTLLADKDGKIVHDFYLKDGEYVLIKDLQAGLTYKVEEVEEDYKKTDGTDKVVDDAKVIIPEHWTVAGEGSYETEEEAKTAALEDIRYDETEGVWIFHDEEFETEQLAQRVALASVKKVAKQELDKTHDDPTQGDLDRNIYTGYTNTRNGIIPTGVMAAAGTGALIVGAGILGLVAMNRRREEDDEEE